MKNKTKVILGLAAMLAGTAGIAGVSTYAWFATQNTATFSFEHAHVVSDSEAITVAYKTGSGASAGITDAMAKNDGTDQNPIGFKIENAKVNVRDISGNGTNFFRPVWDSTENTNVKASSITGPLTQDSTNTKWVQFEMIVSNKGTAATQVYLDTGSTVSALTGAADPTASAQAALSTRIAIYDVTNSALKTIWQSATDGAVGGKYQMLVASTGGNTGTAYQTTASAANLIGDVATDETYGGVFHAGAWSDVGTTPFTPANGQLIASLGSAGSTTASVDLKVCAWIEGTLSTASNVCIGGDVNFSINLKARKN